MCIFYICVYVCVQLRLMMSHLISPTLNWVIIKYQERKRSGNTHLFIPSSVCQSASSSTSTPCSSAGEWWKSLIFLVSHWGLFLGLPMLLYLATSSWLLLSQAKTLYITIPGLSYHRASNLFQWFSPSFSSSFHQGLRRRGTGFTNSVGPPLLAPMVGVPQAMHSMKTMPKGSWDVRWNGFEMGNGFDQKHCLIWLIGFDLSK